MRCRSIDKHRAAFLTSINFAPCSRCNMDADFRCAGMVDACDGNHCRMSALSRIDPFVDMGDWFNGFILRPVLRDFEAEPQMKLEVAEDDKGYRVKAEIPGVNKEDIQVSADGNLVSISAEVKQEKEEKKDEKAIRSERYYGKVSRTFSLAGEVEQSGAQAKYADGVLELTLPKKAGSPSKRITVS